MDPENQETPGSTGWGSLVGRIWAAGPRRLGRRLVRSKSPVNRPVGSEDATCSEWMPQNLWGKILLLEVFVCF